LFLGTCLYFPNSLVNDLSNLALKKPAYPADGQTPFVFDWDCKGSNNFLICKTFFQNFEKKLFVRTFALPLFRLGLQR
ncbi:MAG: hypothetical protein ACI4A2_06635, partial [Candidatus Cryptobacteroides sp.]